jgi:hypothetical protein
MPAELDLALPQAATREPPAVQPFIARKGGGQRRWGGGSGRGGGRGGLWALDTVNATLSAFATEHRAHASTLRTTGAPTLAELNKQAHVATATSVTPGTQLLCSPKSTRLPVLARFCKRTAEACGPVDEVLRNALQPPSARDRPPLVHVELGRKGAGFGAVMQEKANLLLLGLLAGRPVFYYSSGDAFNAGHTLLSATGLGGAGAGVSRASERPLDGLPQALGFASARECSAKLATKQRVFWQCPAWRTFRSTGGAPAQWVPTLDDGDASAFINGPMRAIWDRWTHRVLKPVEAAEFFPNRSAIAFMSPSVTNAFLSDFVGVFSAPDTPLGRKVQLLARGAGEFNGPICLVRHLTRRTSKAVLRNLLFILSPTASCPEPDAAECADAQSGALLVGLHLRRGDKAMMRECHECVNLEDPDVQPTSADRIELSHFEQGLASVNRTVTHLRTSLRREVMVFVASDTVQGLHMARVALGPRTPLITVDGFAVHSTRTLHTATPDGIKVVTDLLAMAVSDVLLAVGQSSFSGLASAVHGGVHRVGGRSVGSEIHFDEAEMMALRASFGLSRTEQHHETQ